MCSKAIKAVSLSGTHMHMSTFFTASSVELLGEVWGGGLCLERRTL